jgi:hypothetical protein
MTDGRPAACQLSGVDRGDEVQLAKLAMPVRSRSPALRTDQLRCPFAQLSAASVPLPRLNSAAPC